nr:unnamed protein product [Digitaria exilis]
MYSEEQFDELPLSALTIATRFFSDDPLGPVASSASFFHLAALLRISSLPITSLTRSATCSLLTSASSRTPTPHASQAYLQLVYWSANTGQHAIGTPSARLSHVEFHPLCVRKHPTAGCFSTFSCGHHEHRPAASGTNAGGSAARPPAAAGEVQQHILRHRSVGCFVNHAGFSSVVEGIVAGCRLVLLPMKTDQYFNAKLFARELRVAVEVARRDEDGWFGRGDVRDAVAAAVATEGEGESRKWRDFFTADAVQDKFVVDFVRELKEVVRA